MVIFHSYVSLPEGNIPMDCKPRNPPFPWLSIQIHPPSPISKVTWPHPLHTLRTAPSAPHRPPPRRLWSWRRRHPRSDLRRCCSCFFNEWLYISILWLCNYVCCFLFACDQVWHLNAFDVLFCKFRSAMKYLYGDTLHVTHDSHLSSMILRRI